MKHLLYLSISLFLILAASCGGEKSKTEELAALKKERAKLDQRIARLEAENMNSDSSNRTPVSVLEVQPADFVSYIEVQGVIHGDENVLATSQAPGVVTRINVRPGQRVSKGQTLALLDAAAVRQQIQAMDAQLSLAKTLYEKQQKLWEQNIGTQIQLLQSKTQYESLLNQKQALIAQRDMYAIKAPVSGVVDAVNIKEGDMVSPGMTGIRVVSKDKLKATASLGENYLGNVQQGDAVMLVFPDIQDSMRSKLSYVAQSIDPLSRSFAVEVKLGAKKNLSPNMSCKMRIANYENPNALLVPVSIVQRTAEGDMILIAEENKAKSISVRTGKNANGMVEILNGLKPGDRVITAGYEDLDNGERIKVME